MTDERFVLPGIFQVTGEIDVGKTMFCLQCGAPPERILFVDDDVKGKSLANDFKRDGVAFGEYINLSELGGKGITEYDLHEKITAELKKIKENMFDVAIFDPWTRIGNSFHSFVVANPRLFRKEWASMGKIKGAQEWKAAREYEAAFLGQLQTKIPTIFLTSHLKSAYVNGVSIPGKFTPDASPAIEKICRARFWLRRNPNGRPVPIALVLKRLNKSAFVPGLGVRTMNVMPQKLIPLPNEESLWDTIFRFWNNPVGDREPTPEEMPDEYELSILGNTLSSDQLHLMESILEAGIQEAEEENAIAGSIGTTSDQEELVKKLHKDGVPLPMIAKQTELAIGIVSQIINDEQSFMS